jgi:transposase
VKRKTDRLDALKLAQMSAMNQLPLVHLPEPRIREWRALIEYRQSLVGRRTRVKNRIRAILDRMGVPQVGSYIGLTPRQYQSGTMDRQGRISGHGHKHLRSLLVEVSWLGLQYNPWMRELYERVQRGSPARKKIAIVAVARRLLIRCWAMLRDETRWQGPSLRIRAAKVA